MVSNVGADPITLAGLLEAFAKQGGATVQGNQLTQGIITDGYLPTLGDTGNSWIALFKKVHDTYDAKAPFDGNVAYGEAVAYTFVQAMVKAGQEPDPGQTWSRRSRAGCRRARRWRRMTTRRPTTAACMGAFIGVIKNGAIVQQGPVCDHRHHPDRRGHAVHRHPARGTASGMP